MSPRDICFCSKDQNIVARPVYILETSCVCYYSHFFSRLAENPGNPENLKFGLFSSKIDKIQFFVTLTSLNRHCDVK